MNKLTMTCAMVLAALAIVAVGGADEKSASRPTSGPPKGALEGGAQGEQAENNWWTRSDTRMAVGALNVGQVWAHGPGFISHAVEGELHGPKEAYVIAGPFAAEPAAEILKHTGKHVRIIYHGLPDRPRFIPLQKVVAVEWLEPNEPVAEKEADEGPEVTGE